MTASRRRRTSDNVLYAVLGGLVCVVLTTGTAVAVSTTAVTITNPTTGKTAHVTNQQSLVTSDRDAVSGTYAKVDALGRQVVGDGSGALSVDGTVSTRPLLPARPWATGIRHTIDATTPASTFYQAVGSQRLALTSATFASNYRVTAYIAVYVNAGTTTPGCNVGGGGGWSLADSIVVVVPAGDTVDLNWPTARLLTPAGNASNYVCMKVEAVGPAGWSLFFAANGFLV